jgi:hypothetical protein
MSMMLAYDLPQISLCKGTIVLRPDLPDNSASLFVRNGDDVRLPAILNDIIGMKPAITLVKPLIWPQG